MVGMDDLTGYKLSRQWFDFCFNNPEKIRPVHTAIYMFALEHWNRLGQKRKFGFPSQMTMDAIGVKSYNTYIPAFRDLVEWGFFELIEKSQNQYSSNIIALSNIDKSNDKALDKAFINHLQSTSQSKCSIDKQINKEQRTSEYAFDDFWDLYDKKKGRKKCEKKWKSLPESEKKKIMEFVPIYKKSEPDSQYRKYPYTFLNSEIWNDEWDEYKNNGSSKVEIDMRRFY